MARWKEFTIAFEFDCDDFMSLSELQQHYDEAMENEDYKEAGKLKKLIDDRANGNESDTFKLVDEPCYIDLEEVTAFYQGEFADGAKYTRVYLRGGDSIPVTMNINDFKHIFFNK